MATKEPMPVARVITVGCRLNQYYSQLIREMLARAGYDVRGAEPELVVVNACAVTGRAERDTRRAVRKGLSEARRVIVTGCPGESIPGLGADVMAYEELARELGIEMPEGISGFAGRARAFLRVQSGCDFSCSYCVVPRLRGPSVSRAFGEIAAEAERLAAAGFREIVVMGTQTGDWQEGSHDLSWLICQLTGRIPGVRFRLSSLEPAHLTPRLIDAIAGAAWRVADHLHLPLQSGSDRILSEMGRPYTLKEYEKKARAAISAIPTLALGTDIIAGFPAENEEDFRETLSFLRDFPFAYAHVFSYSARPGTRSFSLEEMSSVIVKERVSSLLAVDRANRLKFAKRFVGEEMIVVGERKKDGATLATSGNYLRLGVKGLAPGCLARVRITRVGEAELVGAGPRACPV
jgi:threonylcarbamoyladenosine tRNA methylthiotransferase MtaB